jgi:adenine-specific DNA-methyltransferase
MMTKHIPNFGPFHAPHTEDEIYPANRGMAFAKITSSLFEHSAFIQNRVAQFQGDSVNLLPLIPDNTVDLILTDPPYHSTKKENIYGDSDFSEDVDFINWIENFTLQFKRILKPNGSLYLFCSSDMAPHIYVRMAQHMNMHGIITWTKPNEPGYDGWKQKMRKTSLRRWYPHTERIIFCSPAVDGNLKRSPFGEFLRDARTRAGLTSNQLTELTGAYGKVNNGGAVSNWETGRNIPSRDQYEKICDAICQTGKVKILPAYEDVIRAFNIDPRLPFIDVWDFMNVRQHKGKHPAEKPNDMLSHIIRTSSHEHDVVLDCFSGSGSTLVSSLQCNRMSIGIEIEQCWVDYAAKRLAALTKTTSSFSQKNIISSNVTQSDLPLFTI